MSPSQSTTAESPRPVSLITGASSGLGVAFAHGLARRGNDLVLVARDRSRLDALAEELRAQHGISADVLAADLATVDGRKAVSDRLSNRVDLLVNNAGFSTSVEFWEADLDLLRQQLALNVTAVMELTHAAVGPMRAVGNGAIINVSSISGIISGPASTYTASKAWVAKFSEGLAHKLAGSGVKVQALCPGYMRTEFHERAGGDTSHVPDALWTDLDDVVDTSLADLDRDWVVSIPGSKYRQIARQDRRKARRKVWRP